MAASVDTLDGFLREMRHRFPEMASRAPLPQRRHAKADPSPTSSLPAIQGLRRAEASGSVAVDVDRGSEAGSAAFLRATGIRQLP